MDFHFERGGAVILMDALPRVRQFGTEASARATVAALGVA
jgi:hypothetical protein